ncbi:class I glutamine amidotransferase-like protein, partial [Gonapodya prolifera JEL478]
PWIANLLSFMKMAWEATELPIVGVCFGHQIMAKALGGEVTLNPQGLEDGITAIRLTDEGRRMLGTSKSSFAINAAHQDAVITMPVTPGIVNMGTTSLCAFQGMHLPGRLLTVQNHPELTVPATIDVVSTHGMDQAAFEAWRERQVELEQKGLDDVWVGGKLLGFILRGGKSIPSDVELETGKV